jgi:TubC N-terminal docking domain
VEPAHIIAQLHAAGCRLIPEGERLRVKHPSALTDELRALIRQHKPALLDWLRQEHPGATEAGGGAGTPGRPSSELDGPVMTPTSHVRRRPRSPSRATAMPPPAHAPQATETTRVEPHKDDVIVEWPLDRVVHPFLEQQPEVWKREHAVCRYDRHHGYVVRFTALALEALVQYVAISSVFGTETERDHYAASLRWVIDHGACPLAHTPYHAGQAHDVLPNQLRLL